jgi:hypothetical protein
VTPMWSSAPAEAGSLWPPSTPPISASSIRGWG